MEMKKYLMPVLAVLLLGVYTAVLLFPYPHHAEPDEEIYLCDIGDRVIELRYSEAYSSLIGFDEEGRLLLERDGERGTIETGEEIKEAVRVLREGELAELLSLRTGGTRLERTALFLVFGERLYFDSGDWFSYTGEKVVLSERRETREVVFVGGTLTGNELIPTGAKTLYLLPRAEFTSETLLGTEADVVAYPPYLTEGGAVFKDGIGGRRLLSGLPSVAEADIVCDYADEGALLPCKKLERLTISFAGSSPSGVGTEFRGELGYLFLSGEIYSVPETLKRVKITGGVIMPTAFYGCGGIEEIDLCGVDPAVISPQAFEGLSLSLLHCPLADAPLKGNYQKTIAPCGCTVYEKVKD